MAKSVRVILVRQESGEWCYLKAGEDEANWRMIKFCWVDFRPYCPELCRGLRPGGVRELVLTQTKRGIKLERPALKRRR